MKKRYANIIRRLCTLVLLYGNFVALFDMMIVDAREAKPYTINGITENVLSLDLDENQTKSINVTGSEEYTVTCTTDNEDNKNGVYAAVSNNNDNVCDITATNYGMAILPISIRDTNNNYYYEFIVIDVDTENYMENVLDLVPSVVNVPKKNLDNLTSYFNMNLPHGFDFTADIYCVGIDTCTPKATIGYNLYKNGVWKYTTKEKTFEINVTGLSFVASIDTLYVNVIKTIDFDNFNGKYADLIFISENNDIAKVTQRGEVTAVSSGTTEIAIYDKETMQSFVLPITVNEKLTNIDEKVENIINTLTNDFEVEIGNKEYFPTYSANNITSDTFSNIVKTYFNKRFSKDLPGLNYNYDLNCNKNGVCSITLNYINNGQKTKKANSFKITLTGLALNNAGNYLLGNSYYLTHESLLEDNDTVFYDYDSEFLQFNDNRFSTLKTGKTIIKAVSASGYSSEIEILIGASSDIKTIMENYLKSKNIIEFPFKDMGLSNLTDLKILEKMVKSHLEENFNNQTIKPYIKADVTCVTKTNCTVKLSLMNSLESNSYKIAVTSARNVKVTYDNTNTVDTSNVINVIDKLKENYYVTFDESLAIEATCSLNNYECYKKEIAKINGLDTLLSTVDVVTVKSGVTSKGSSTNYKLFSENEIYEDKVIKIDGVPVYYFTVTYHMNHILSVDVTANIKSEQEKIAYIKAYIDNYYGITNTVVTYIEEDVYNIKTDILNFNIIAIKKDKVKAYNIEFSEKLIALNIGEVYKTTLVYSPKDANFFDHTYVVADESVATIDGNGVITAKKRGITIIKIVNGTSVTQGIVSVDISIESYLNELLELLNTNVVVDYNKSNVDSTIMDTLSELLEDIVQIPVSIHLGNKNDKYFVQLYVNDSNGNIIYSNAKDVNITKKGISFDKKSYYLNEGENIQIGLTYTEGSTNNLLYKIDNTKIVSFDIKTKTLKGLRPGATTVWVYDKDNNYSNYFYVYVNLEEAIKGDLENDDNSIILDAKEIINGIENAIYNKLYGTDSLSALINSDNVNITCDENTKTCNVSFKANINGEEIEYNEEVSYIIRGILLDNVIVDIDTNESYIPNVEVLSDIEETLTIKTYDPDVCHVSGNKIVGDAPGFCHVKFSTTSGYTNYLTLIVDKEEIINIANDKLNAIPNEILLGIETFDRHIAKTDLAYLENYKVMLANEISKYISNNYKINYDFNNLTTDNKMDISLSIYDSFSIGQEYWPYINLDDTDSKTFTLSFSELDKDGYEGAMEIVSKIDALYTLDINQIIALKLRENSLTSAYKYSSFLDILKDYPDYELLYVSESEIQDETLATNYGSYYLLYKGVLISTGKVGFKVVLDITDTLVDSSEELNQLIKSRVKEAYLAEKDILDNEDNLFVMESYAPFNNQSVVTVSVDTKYDVTNMEMIYVISVNELIFGSFVLSTGTKKVSEIKLDFKELTLIIGESKTIPVTVSPSDATNPKLIWTSSNPSVASVNNGVVTAKGEGTAIITVKSEDGSCLETIAVTINKQPITILYGDVNLDGSISLADLIALRKYLAGNIELSEHALMNANVTKDSSVNMADLIKLRKCLAGLEELK